MTTPHKADAQIQEDVQAELNRDWRFRPAEMGVEVDEGIVTLTGTVSTYTKLIAAADVAAQVSGVRGVANDLTVRPAEPGCRDDTQLAAAVRSALLWNADVPADRLEVIVRHGAVTLRGQVDHWYQRKVAAGAAGQVSGVICVNDQIDIVPPALADLEIKMDIRKALMRRLPYLADAIEVDVERGLVTLSGEVHTYTERLQAANAAWAADGARSVMNLLRATW